MSKRIKFPTTQGTAPLHWLKEEPVADKLTQLVLSALSRAAAERAISTVTPFVVRYPTAFAMWLQAIDLALADVVEIAIVGAPDDPGTLALLAVARGYDPHRVVASSAPGANGTMDRTGLLG